MIPKNRILYSKSSVRLIRTLLSFYFDFTVAYSFLITFTIPNTKQRLENTAKKEKTAESSDFFRFQTAGFPFIQSPAATAPW